MSAKPLADAYEELKELRRQGELGTEIQSRIKTGLLGSLAVGISPVNLIRILDIKTLADRVFADEEKAEAWLRRPNASLSEQKPIDLLKDELGAAVVREMLERIDHGIFA